MLQYDEYWETCRATLGDEALGDAYTVRRIGNSEALTELILGLIISGDKTGTFSLPRALKEAGVYPGVGDFVILTHFDGRPACLVRMQACELMPFAEIGPAELKSEGSGAREVKAWRTIHKAYWKPTLASWGESFSEDIPVLVQRFRLLHVA